MTICQKHILILSTMAIGLGTMAQNVALPEDLRQHNLSQFNSNLFNPIFSLDRTNPNSLAIWSRWQWQSIDADPTTLFIGYSGKFNPNAAYGVGFLQHNTGDFLQTGGYVNAAFSIEVTPESKLAVGINITGFLQEFTNNNFLNNPDTFIPQFKVEDQFIIRYTPSIQYSIENFSIAAVGENYLDMIFPGVKDTERSDKIFLGIMSYKLPISIFGSSEKSYIRPSVYLKSFPDNDNQYGFTSLFSTPKFWVQAGYNNFYGMSGGIGGTFFDKFSLGALIELGTSTELNGKDPTFEIVTAYHFGVPDFRKKVVGFEVEEEVPTLLTEEEEVIAEKKEEKDLTRIQRLQDSLAMLKAKEVQEAKKQVIEEKPKEGERYEEAVLTEDIRPGYYIIVNVFGTQRYYNIFMNTLTEKGLQPKSFYRSQRKLNYVYLERYDSYQEARNAVDSQYYGSYKEAIWIFRVKTE